MRQNFLGSVPASSTPVVYCMAGIPAAGKSSFVNRALAAGTFPSDAFVLDPDRVMTTLPEYQRDLTRWGMVKAYETWEMPARDLAYAMFEDAVDRRANIIKDMGCVRTENYEKLQHLKTLGYALNMFYINCPVDESLRRAALRPRHTPESMIRERHVMLQDLLPRYRALADHFTEIDGLQTIPVAA